MKKLPIPSIPSLLKGLLFLFLLIPFLSFAAGPTSPATNGPIKIVINWMPDPAYMAGLSTNDFMTNIASFVIYSTTNISFPVWTPYTNVPPAIGWSTNLVNNPGVSTFFAATVKTTKGNESFFSPNDIWPLANSGQAFGVFKGP